MTLLGTYICPTNRFLPRLPPPREPAGMADARSLWLAVQPTAMAGLDQQQQLQQQRHHLQTRVQLNSLVHEKAVSVVQQPGWTNTAVHRPCHWLAVEKEEKEPTPKTGCQKHPSTGAVQVPGVGPIKKSDLVLLRAVHKGLLDAEHESAPDVSKLTPQQLGHLETFLDASEDELWLLGLSKLRPPPGLEELT